LNAREIRGEIWKRKTKKNSQAHSTYGGDERINFILINKNFLLTKSDLILSICINLKELTYMFGKMQKQISQKKREILLSFRKED